VCFALINMGVCHVLFVCKNITLIHIRICAHTHTHMHTHTHTYTHSLTHSLTHTQVAQDARAILLGGALEPSEERQPRRHSPAFSLCGGGTEEGTSVCVCGRVCGGGAEKGCVCVVLIIISPPPPSHTQGIFNLGLLEGSQLTRLCDLRDPNVDLMYITPFELPGDIIQYYMKLFQVCVYVCKGGRERECVCVCAREGECVCVCV
jgi:hypothetical protein